jgi:hypothetical protein
MPEKTIEDKPLLAGFIHSFYAIQVRNNFDSHQQCTEIVRVFQFLILFSTCSSLSLSYRLVLDSKLHCNLQHAAYLQHATAIYPFQIVSLLYYDEFREFFIFEQGNDNKIE